MKGKFFLKPPYRMHSNKKAGIKPKLVPSVVFRDPLVWEEIEKMLKENLAKGVPIEPKGKTGEIQLDFFSQWL